MALEQAEAALVENPDVQVIYADGISGVEIHGHVARITFFEYRIEAGEDIRMPVLTMVRPIESVITTGLAELVRDAMERHQALAKLAKRFIAH